MNMQRWMRGLAALTLAGLTFAQALAQTAPTPAPNPAPASATGSEAPKPPEFTAEKKQIVLADVARIIENFAFVPGVDLAKWNDFVAERKEAIEKAADQRAFANEINGALRKFGISHIVLATPQAAEARRTRQNVGIGVILSVEDAGLRVTAVFPQSPAAEAGLREGDLIVEANGKAVKQVSDMAGEEGQTANLKVQRKEETKEFTIVRRKYSNVRPETLTWQGDDTAILKVNTFDLGYNRTNVETLMKEAAKAKNLVIDLRNNGGGAVANMIHLLNMLLPPDTDFGTFISKNLVNSYVKETEGSPTDLAKIAAWSKTHLSTSEGKVPYFPGKIGVLVNGASGSASEITAQALRELRDAKVAGSKSAGAVLVSIMRPIAEGFLLQYPMSDYVSIKGLRIEGNGVVPDVEAKLAKYGEPDEAVAKVVELLKGSN